MAGNLDAHIDRLFERSGYRILSPDDESILSIALDSGTSQERLDSFLAGWDIEKAPIKSVMLLAYALESRPDLVLPPSVGPRLGGVLKFCRYQNINKLAHFSKVARELRANGIPVLILKGGAMKVYRPSFPRWMNDVDFLVRPSDYGRAVEIAMGMGYGEPMATEHSTDLRVPGSGEGLLDIHRCLDLSTGREEELSEDLFRRAEEKVFFSVKGYLPSPEDMVFIALTNLYKNLERNQTPESSVTTFFDLKYLVGFKPVFDWGIVLENARKTGTLFQVLLSANILSRNLGGIIPGDLMERSGTTAARFERQLVDFLYRRDVLCAARDSFQQTKVGAMVQKDINVLTYIWIGFVKMVRGVSRIPAFKRLALKMKYASGGGKDKSLI